MWRYLAGAGAGALLVAAGMMLQAMRPARRRAAGGDAGGGKRDRRARTRPVAVPEATAKTREEKRFNRYDKDRDGRSRATNIWRRAARHMASSTSTTTASCRSTNGR